MLNVKSTRSELLRTKTRIKLAKRGHDLLKKKQDSLVIEFFKLLKETKERQLRLQERYAAASRMMKEARVLESDLRIKAGCLAVQEAAPVGLRMQVIAGVKVPVVVRTEQQRPIYNSLLLQDVGNAYYEVLVLATELAAKETALRKILIEIRKTKRRSNALQDIMIPRLQAAKSHIQFELEERERENFSRLKRRKAS